MLNTNYAGGKNMHIFKIVQGTVPDISLPLGFNLTVTRIPSSTKAASILYNHYIKSV